MIDMYMIVEVIHHGECMVRGIYNGRLNGLMALMRVQRKLLKKSIVYYNSIILNDLVDIDRIEKEGIPTWSHSSKEDLIQR